MSRAFLIPALLAVLLTTAGPVFAQATTGQAAPPEDVPATTEAAAAPGEATPAPSETAPPVRPGQLELQERIERWGRVLTRVDAQLHRS